MAITAAAPARPADEAALVARAVAGDREAFGELYACHQAKVRNVISRLLTDYPSDVDDVASDVFLRALDLIETYQDRGRPFAAWLNEIVHWRVVSHRSWRRHRRELPLDETGQAAVAPGLGTEDQAILRLELRAVLNTLTERRRRALVLHDWAGLPYAEVARHLDLSPRNTGAAINLGRQAARQAARGLRPLVDRTVCECGCGQPIEAGRRFHRFARPICWRRAVNERRRAQRRLTAPSTRQEVAA